MQPSVYLAGPITGCSYAGCTDWREYVTYELGLVGIKAWNPMRGKEYLSHVENFTSDGDKYKELYGVNHVMSTNRGIMTRDRFDATRCTALFVNLLGATKVSVGTVMEIAMGDITRKPIICAMEDEGNPHAHGMILEAIGFRVTTLEEAIHVTKAMLKV